MITVRELNASDLAGMMEMAQDLAQFNPSVIARIEKAMALRFANDPRSFVFGQFEDDKLMAWAHFKQWDDGDGKAYTWGVTQRYKSAVPMLNHAGKFFADLGITNCYVMKPVNSMSSVIGKEGSFFKDWKWETIEIVKAGDLSSIPLINKYVLTTVQARDYEVGRMVK